MYATLILEFDSDQISYYQSSNLHGYLMESIDSRYAQLLHTNHLNPYSQYVMKENGRTYWHINTLNAEAYEKIILPLSKVKQVTIKNGSIVAPVISTQMSVQREQELLNEFYNTHSNGYLEISFLTPTAFKKDGRYIFYPDLNLLYGSLMRKYTENSQSMSMFDTDTLNELAKRSEIVRYRIQTVPFPLEKVRITGFIGTICIRVKGNETMARYARMLFSFGEYSGIGIKAGMEWGHLGLAGGKRMKDRKLKVIAGALLHDVGKVIYREGTDKRNHSVSGYDYLKEEAGITDQEILDCVKNHHISLLKNAGLEENSLAYIVYIADNIAAFADRRKKDFTDDTGEQGFEIATPLQSVFNILNGNQQEYYYSPGDMSPESKINYPTPVKQKFSEHYYSVIKERLSDNLKGLTLTDEYINSLLSVMEANLSYMPSSTAKAELSDISLFDHVKLTAAIASCIYDYLEEKGQNYKQQLLAQESSFYDENAFMLCSLDISGIQSFIYTIASKNALRTLRTRSFYLEMMMEHMIDMVLGSLELSRANLIYSGGGHCYLLVPNTKNCLAKLEEVCEKLQWWFLENFQTDLYVTFGTAACSGNIMRNVPEGSYAELFHSVTGKLSEQKQQRYSAKQILWLNRRREKDYSRECKVCRKIGAVDDEEVCSLCRRIEAFSKNVLYSDFYTVVVEDCEGALPLPGGAYLIEDSEKSLKKRMDEDANFVRAYAKNKMYTGKHIATKLWVGDYTTGDTFEEFAKKATGINRIGILRADVDNLGQAFVAGFNNKENHNRYVTLSRTTTLSRQLSIFFKYFINDILKNAKFHIDADNHASERKTTIIYSGGDDVFVVGAWDDVIELGIDLKEAFEKYTQGTLSISAGIGVYEHAYPIAAIARETGDMESASKHLPGKNAVTLFEDGEKHIVSDEKGSCVISDGTYSWDELKNEVILEKYRTIEKVLGNTENRGMSFLYHMLELIRNQKEKINFARFVYLLSKLETDDEELEQKKQYRDFSKKMIQWVQNEKDCRQLKTAINMYAYMQRKEGDASNADNRN